MLAALDAMPEKALVTEELETPEGEVCSLGALGKARGIDMSNLDPENPDHLASVFGVAPQLIREIEYENDEGGPRRTETPEDLWKRMRAWIASRIIPQEPAQEQENKP
jgi:hypothetical protein